MNSGSTDIEETLTWDGLSLLDKVCASALLRIATVPPSAENIMRYLTDEAAQRKVADFVLDKYEAAGFGASAAIVCVAQNPNHMERMLEDARNIEAVAKVVCPLDGDERVGAASALDALVAEYRQQLDAAASAEALPE